MTRILDERGPGLMAPASELEHLMLRALDAAGLPRPVAQHPFPGRQVIAGCVDAAYPDARIILEADGRRWHSRVRDLVRDRARDNEAARAGWQTLRFMTDELRSDPVGVAETVGETRRMRLEAAA